MPGLLKIGATKKHPHWRAQELAAGTGVPSEFTIEYYVGVDDCFGLEAALHNELAAHRYNDKREFFVLDVGSVVDCIRDSSINIYDEGGRYIETAQDFHKSIPTPFADLFATFPDDGSDRELTPEEQARCRALWAQLKGVQ